MKRIGVYGGAFDPPHIGHVLVGAYALAMARLDELIVVPCWRHAFGKDMTDYWQRLELTRRAFGILGEKVLVSSVEWAIKCQHTYDLLAYYRSSHHHPASHQLVLIMGSDDFQDFPKWHRHEEILQMAEVFMVGRQGTVQLPGSVDIPNVSSSLIRQRIQEGQNIQSLLPPAVLGIIREKHLYGFGDCSQQKVGLETDPAV